MTNCPSPADLTELVSPVSRLAMVMVALGTTAPEGSVTVPTMVASCANALHASNANSAQIAKIQCKRGPAFAARRLLNTLNCVMRSSCQSLLWSSKLDEIRSEITLDLSLLRLGSSLFWFATATRPKSCRNLGLLHCHTLVYGPSPRNVVHPAPMRLRHGEPRASKLAGTSLKSGPSVGRAA